MDTTASARDLTAAEKALVAASGHSVPQIAQLSQVHRHTVYGWVDPGLKNMKTGKIVRLRARKRGGRLKIRLDDLEAFHAALNEDGDGDAVPSIDTNAAIEREADDLIG